MSIHYGFGAAVYLISLPTFANATEPAFVMSLTRNTGTVVLYATPKKDGTMPASLMAAYKAIDPTAVITPLRFEDTPA